MNSHLDRNSELIRTSRFHRWLGFALATMAVMSFLLIVWGIAGNLAAGLLGLKLFALGLIGGAVFTITGWFVN